MENPILDEVREARAALAEEHDFDRHEILQWARKEHAASQKRSNQEGPSKSVEATAGRPPVKG